MEKEGQRRLAEQKTEKHGRNTKTLYVSCQAPFSSAFSTLNSTLKLFVLGSILMMVPCTHSVLFSSCWSTISASTTRKRA